MLRLKLVRISIEITAKKNICRKLYAKKYIQKGICKKVLSTKRYMQKDIIDKKIYAKRVLSTGITKNRTKLCVQPGPTSVNLINLYTNSKK